MYKRIIALIAVCALVQLSQAQDTAVLERILGEHPCLHKLVGQRLSHPTDPRKFMRCVASDTLWIETCPANLIYNAQEEVCDWAPGSQAQIPTTTTTTTTTTTPATFRGDFVQTENRPVLFQTRKGIETQRAPETFQSIQPQQVPQTFQGIQRSQDFQDVQRTQDFQRIQPVNDFQRAQPVNNFQGMQRSQEFQGMQPITEFSGVQGIDRSQEFQGMQPITEISGARGVQRDQMMMDQRSQFQGIDQGMGRMDNRPQLVRIQHAQGRMNMGMDRQFA